MKKQEFGQIFSTIGLFMIATGLLTSKVVKQCRLPNRNRKGNILSSALMLFVLLNDLVTTFSWGFSLHFIVRWKHYARAVVLVRKSVLLTGCLLFFLSSFEWSCPPTVRLTGDQVTMQVEGRLNPAPKRAAIAFHAAPFVSTRVKRLKKNASQKADRRGGGLYGSAKIYLQNCQFRI